MCFELQFQSPQIQVCFLSQLYMFQTRYDYSSDNNIKKMVKKVQISVDKSKLNRKELSRMQFNLSMVLFLQLCFCFYNYVFVCKARNIFIRFCEEEIFLFS